MASEEGKQQESKGFTVQDKRRFSPDTGEARKDFTRNKFFDVRHRIEHAGADAFGRNR